MAGDGDEKNSAFGDQAGSVELLWGGRERRSRGPKPALSLERITQTAITLADAGGLGAVSMQRVAAELDFTKMSLYRYVPGKSELVALMIDSAMGEPPEPAGAAAGDWRGALREWAERLAAVFERHPWLLHAVVGPRVMGPNELGWTERALAALADTGLTGSERLDAVVVVSGHIRAMAQVSASMGLGSARAKEPEAVMSAALNELLVGRSERFPALAAAVADAAESRSRDQAWEFGLERILDGLEAYVGRA
ncbi:TetR/AcrR family transcriptional regulator C-terminal domain-containing protein [Streptomyces sp. BHT-5-2]|uniref:TetR/AcrR family transcriptional regulator n=1 Tax=unclassified Streptomyces TaxID=2593676 RepID=UPI001C8DE84E|nr:TetR/AcrR family transcriptional regulator C-terminal domain-containing protein [Streptomyces sp. BHT-5-2]QZL02056.1 TetR/AcrR family transcriptional regulator C-terminal domain-containing protein [Streptomyces sp. BHT-5-2]